MLVVDFFSLSSTSPLSILLNRKEGWFAWGTDEVDRVAFVFFGESVLGAVLAATVITGIW